MVFQCGWNHFLSVWEGNAQTWCLDFRRKHQQLCICSHLRLKLGTLTWLPRAITSSIYYFYLFINEMQTLCIFVFVVVIQWKVWHSTKWFSEFWWVSQLLTGLIKKGPWLHIRTLLQLQKLENNLHFWNNSCNRWILEILVKDVFSHNRENWMWLWRNWLSHHLS